MARWPQESKMHGETRERVFRHQRKYRRAAAVLAVATLVLALFSTYKVATANSDTVFEPLMIHSWFLTPFLVYILIQLQGMIVVDHDSIAYSSLFRSVRIPFSEVTDFELSRTHLRICSKKHRIAAGIWFADIREMTEVVKRLFEEARNTGSAAMDEETSERKIYRYSAGFKCLVKMELALLVICGILMILVRPDGKQSGWVTAFAVIVASTAVVLHVLHRTKATVELLDDFLYWQRGRQTITIPYDAIRRTVVKKTRLGRQYLDIAWNDKRLHLSAALVPFDRLVAQMSRKTTVSWAGHWPLRFPVTVKGSAGMEQTIMVLVGLVLSTLSLYLVVDNAYWTGLTFTFVGGGAVVGLAFIVFGILLQSTYDSPSGIRIRRKHIIFGRRRFVIVDLQRCHTYRVRDVTDVYLHVDNSLFTTYRLEIGVAGKRIVLADVDRNVPLVPLYELLCKAYWPEGYREPAVTLNGIRRDCS